MSTFSPAEQEYARLDALLEAVPLAVAVFDGALLLAATNARYRDLTGVDVTQAIGRSVYDAFPNALADLTEQVDIAAGGVPVVSVRVPFQYRGGRRLVEATFSPLLDARGGRGLDRRGAAPRLYAAGPARAWRGWKRESFEAGCCARAAGVGACYKVGRGRRKFNEAAYPH